MNILLLTPDAVGGTLLERLITIYAQFQNFDHPVIDVGHIELGIEKYFCPTFGQEIVTSSRNFSNEKYNFVQKQKIKDIVDLLSSVNHYKICKLPCYNMMSRNDSSEDLAPFYQYLNNNYFIISCRRENLFEHALSWALNKITKQLNVFSVEDKINFFYDLYQNKISIDPLSIIQSLNTYKNYIDWADKNFQISSYYFYEKHLPNIEEYIFSLPMFKSQRKNISWKDVYNIEFNDWNRCHYYCSDIGGIASSIQQLPTLNVAVTSKTILLNCSDVSDSWNKFVLSYEKISNPSWPKINSVDDFFNLPEYIQDECKTRNIMYFLEETIIKQNLQNQKYTNKVKKIQMEESWSQRLILAIENNHNEFLNQKKAQYIDAHNSIKKMMNLNIIPTTVPIKKQKLNEKKFIIENFKECTDAYNAWIVDNPGFGKEINDIDIEEQIRTELNFWNQPATTRMLK